MEDMLKKSCEQYLAELASRSPVPGGGGTAALVGALGVALGNMVGNLTLGKKKYFTVQEDMLRLNNQADVLRQTLEQLVNADAEVFEPLSRAYGLPRSTPEEQAHRAAVLEEALDAASAVPMEIMERCAQAIELVEEYAEKGSALAISDAGCAAALCLSALASASMNVFINTRSMTNKERSALLNAKARKLLEEYVPRGERVVNSVTRRLMD